MKGQRSLVPTLFSPISDSQTLSVIQILAVKDWRENCTKRSFFNIEDNYKCNANEASHTSLLFGRLLNTHNVGNFRTGTFKVRKRRLKLIESCHNRVHGTCSLRYSITFMWKALCLKIEKKYISLTPYFLLKISLAYCKECRAECSPCGGEYCQSIPACCKRRLKGSMLKVNLLFIVKEAWFR